MEDSTRNSQSSPSPAPSSTAVRAASTTATAVAASTSATPTRLSIRTVRIRPWMSGGVAPDVRGEVDQLAATRRRPRSGNRAAIRPSSRRTVSSTGSASSRSSVVTAAA